MSEFVWGTAPKLPEKAAEAAEPQTTALRVATASISAAPTSAFQTSAPHDNTSEARPQTRRELREQREREASMQASAQPAAEPAVQADEALSGDLDVVFGEAAFFDTIVTPDEIVPDVALTQDAAPEVAEFGTVSDPAPTSRPRNTKRRPAARKKAPSRPASRPAAAPVWPTLAKPRKKSGHSLLAKLMSFGAMVGVGAMLVATSVPANAFYSETVAAVEQEAPPAEVQSLGVQAAEAVTAQASTRDAYTVVSLADQLRKKYGNQTFEFTNNPNGTIQWPFATSVPISSGFGARAACSFCSSNHKGLDFAPGAGVPIQAIADGVVNDVIVSNSGYGVHVIVDHVINGQQIQVLYAHMQWGSPGVAKGQSVVVGQYIGAVGNTGASTGAHLHFEVHLEGTPVDPFAWLKANAN